MGERLILARVSPSPSAGSTATRFGAPPRAFLPWALLLCSAGPARISLVNKMPGDLADLKSGAVLSDTDLRAANWRGVDLRG